MNPEGLSSLMWVVMPAVCMSHVQNRLDGLVVAAGILYCTLALVSMILNAVNSPAIPL